MSLINQVLKDIEQRQDSSKFEESELKTQLHPVLAINDDEWRLPKWLKLFVLGFIAGAVIYFVWENVWLKTNTNAPLTRMASDTSANLDWQAHPRLTKTLSSDWQAMEYASPASSKASVKHAPKLAADQNEGLPKPLLNQAEQLKPSTNRISNTTNTGNGNTLSAVVATEPSATLLTPVITAPAPAMSKQETSVTLIKPADPNFSSAITPLSDADPVQVLKQMKPEQEANQHLQRAMDMHQKGRIAEAIDATKKALSLAPQSEDARQLLASYLVESKQSQEAVQVLQSGLQLQPKQLGLRKALAKLQLAEGQQDKALETLQQGADQAPRDADYSAFWALTLQKVNKHHAALPLFEQALRSNPNQVQWLIGYAVSLQADGRSQDALKQFQEAQNLPTSERLSAFIQQRIQQLQNP